MKPVNFLHRFAEDINWEHTPSPSMFRPERNPNALALTVNAIRKIYDGYVDTTKTKTIMYPYEGGDFVQKWKVARAMGFMTRKECLDFAAYLMAVEPQLTESGPQAGHVHRERNTATAIVTNSPMAINPPRRCRAVMRGHP